LRVGLPVEYLGDGLDPEIRASLDRAVHRLGSEGVEFESVSLPHTEYGVATYYLIATAEASSNLGRFDGVRYGQREEPTETLTELTVDDVYTATRSQGFGLEVKRRIMLGTYVLSAGYYEAYYDKAQRVRRLMFQDFERVFEKVDFVLAPATQGPAFKIGSKVDDVLAMYLNDIYTVPASLAGIPGLVLPTAVHPPGLPIGLQILGSHFQEDRLMWFGAALERTMDGNEK
jgi:aspartyl-tRNA(Asn)/glutamyl-tRNA(Gln) amidotransferase subunit A